MAKPVELEQTQATSREVTSLQQAVQRYLRQLDQCDLIDGRLIDGVALTTSATVISHGLGRVPQGWSVVDRGADARVWRTAWDAKHLTLQASASVTVAVWVF